MRSVRRRRWWWRGGGVQHLELLVLLHKSGAAAHITTGSVIVPSQECLITAQSGKFNSSKTFFLQHKEQTRMSVHHTDTAADESFFCESISFYSWWIIYPHFFEMSLYCLHFFLFPARFVKSHDKLLYWLLDELPNILQHPCQNFIHSSIIFLS